jgi:hypothetical protein
MAARISFIIVAIGLVIAGTWAYQHDAKLRTNSGQVNLGDSGEVVRTLLGDPSSEQSCGSLTPAPATCREELVYRYWYSVFQPKYEVIWFDANDKVLGAEYVHSQF